MLTTLLAALLIQTTPAPDAEPTPYDAIFCSGVGELMQRDFAAEDQTDNALMAGRLMAGADAWMAIWIETHTLSDADKTDIAERMDQRASEMDADEDVVFEELERCGRMFIAF